MTAGLGPTLLALRALHDLLIVTASEDHEGFAELARQGLASARPFLQLGEAPEPRCVYRMTGHGAELARELFR